MHRMFLLMAVVSLIGAVPSLMRGPKSIHAERGKEMTSVD
jgi:hypothetical protein